MSEASPPTRPALGRLLLGAGSWAFVGRGATSALSFLTAILVARLLDPAETGAYFLALSLVTTAAIVARLGLENTAVRMVSRAMARSDPGAARQALGRVVRLGVAGAVVVALVLAIVLVPWLGRVVFDSPLLVGLAGWIGAWTFAMAIQLLLAECFRGFHEIREAVLFGGVIASLLSVLGLAGLYAASFGFSLEAVVGLIVVCTFANASLASYGLARKLRSLPEEPREPVAPPLSVLRSAFPILVSNLNSCLLLNLDLWVVGAFLPERDVAFYGAAVRLVMFVKFSILITNQVLPPIIGELYAAGERERLERVIRGIAGLSLLPSAAVAVLFVFFGEATLGLAFGEAYAEAATVLAVLTVGQLVNVWSGSCAFTLMMTGRQKALMVVTAASALAAVVGTLLAAPVYGAVGVASALTAALVAQQVALLLVTKKLTGLWTHASLGSMVHGVRHVLRNR